MKKIVLFALILAVTAGCRKTVTDPFVSQEEMAEIYQQIKTPDKFGVVVTASKKGNYCDSPGVFRHGDRWYMSWIEFGGEGYETHLSGSDDLLHWEYLGKIMSYRTDGWDKWQRAGYVSLQDIDWGGTYELEKFNGKYWMGYLGGSLEGYETRPLSIGMAYTDDPSKPVEWESMDAPVLSPKDDSVQWFEKLTQYKSNIFEDKENLTGHKFLMYYNACGVNPENGISAERIGIAFSDDMVNWERYSGNPVLGHEDSNTITGDPQIQKIGDLYVMFYFRAFVPNKPYRAYNTFACSRDLIHWYDWEGEDLIYPTEDFDGHYAHKSYVVNWKGVTYHFYCAVDSSEKHRCIAVATSVPMGHSDIKLD